MAYPGYMTYGASELFNNARFNAYAHSLVGTLEVSNCDPCGSLDTEYTDPATDGAPWYNSGYAATEQFVGLLPLSIQGLDDDGREATITQRHGDGGYVSRVRRTTKEVRFTALLVGATDAGLEYGTDWLRGVLNARQRGPAFGKEGGFVLPPGVNGYDCLRDRVDLVFYQACPNSEDGLLEERILRDAACTGGISVLQNYASSKASMRTIEFSLTAGDPWVYGVPTTPAAPTLSSGSMPSYSCPAPAPLTTITDPACPPIPPPPRPPVIPSCASTATRNQRVGWIIPGSDLNVAQATFPVITVHANSQVTNLAFRVWPLPEGATTAASLDACDTVGNMIIGDIAAGRDFTIEGDRQTGYTTLVEDGWDFNVYTSHLIYPPESVPAVPGAAFEAFSIQWPTMYGGGDGYVIYLEGASGSAFDATLSLVTRR